MQDWLDGLGYTAWDVSVPEFDGADDEHLAVVAASLPSLASCISTRPDNVAARQFLSLTPTLLKSRRCYGQTEPSGLRHVEGCSMSKFPRPNPNLNIWWQTLATGAMCISGMFIIPELSKKGLL